MELINPLRAEVKKKKKAFPVHAIKAHRRVGSTPALSLNLGTRFKSLVNYTLRKTVHMPNE
jgi:hypothetical protein